MSLRSGIEAIARARATARQLRIAEQCSLRDIYYTEDGRDFVVRNGARFQLHKDVSFKRWLKVMPHQWPYADDWPTHDEWMVAAQQYQAVDYAGPLSGHPIGRYDFDGLRMLVIREAHHVELEPGAFRTILRIIRGLFGEARGMREQVHAVLGWLKDAVDAVRNTRHGQAQVLAIAGPAGVGKSLFQSIVTLALGGRSCHIFQAMAGDSSFNADWFGAESLLLEDENPSSDGRARAKLASAIKRIAVNDTHSCHAKNKTPVMLRPIWRLTISLNDDEEAMRVLPNLEGGTEDKIMLLMAGRFNLPVPEGLTAELRRSFLANRIEEELPSFLHWLLNVYEVPAEYRDPRYAVATFHHPDLRVRLTATGPERALLEQIDGCPALWSGARPWVGTATALLRTLGVSHLAPHVAGRYLRILSHLYPDRIQMQPRSESRSWRIHPPMCSAVPIT